MPYINIKSHQLISRWNLRVPDLQISFKTCLEWYQQNRPSNGRQATCHITLTTISNHVCHASDFDINILNINAPQTQTYFCNGTLTRWSWKKRSPKFAKKVSNQFSQKCPWVRKSVQPVLGLWLCVTIWLRMINIGDLNQREFIIIAYVAPRNKHQWDMNQN